MGEIPIEDIRGRVLFRIFPFDRFGLVDSNWNTMIILKLHFFNLKLIFEIF
jgi:hypothetical protein